MYKVVVVDDEPFILRSIKKSIENTHSGFQVVAEISDSETAVDIIEKLSPDIVFTDIRMPIVDGLSLIEELLKRNIQSKVVILSGYQEFDYAKKALKFGVEDYLLKPISHGVLKELLDEIYNSLECLKKQWQYQLLESLICTDINNVIPSSQISRYFGKFKFFTALLICSGSFCTFRCNWLTPAKDFWFKTDLNLLLFKVLENKYAYWTLELDHGNDRLIVFASQNDSRVSLNETYKQIYDQLNKEQFPITIVATDLITSLNDLSYAIQYCKIILNKSIIFGSSRLLFSNALDNSSGNLERLIDINSEKLFCMFIEKNQLMQFKQEFKQILNTYEDRQTSQLRLESMLKYMVNLFRISFSHIPQNRLLEAEMEINELISNSVTYQSLYDGMSIIFDDLFYFTKGQLIGKKNQEYLVAQVESYILENYSQQISLQTIADKFGIVLPYLSSLFKKYKGISPMNFIINLRIEKAKKLLQINSSLTVKDIAQSIGYDDPYYMSRIFKSITGRSPSQYRQDILKT